MYIKKIKYEILLQDYKMWTNKITHIQQLRCSKDIQETAKKERESLLTPSLGAERG